MSKATLTMIGLYNWDPDLFKNLILPDGIDRSTTIDCILLQSGEFEVLYSDCDFMENAIGYVSRKWQRTFQKWYEALQLEYHPIENYDRYEEWTDEGKNTGTVTHGTSHKTDSTGNQTVNGSNSESVKGSTTGHTKDTKSESANGTSSDMSSSSSTTDTYVSTYDSNALNQDNESKSTQTANSSGSTGQTTEGTNTQESSESNSQDTTGSNSQNSNSSGSVTESGSDNESRNLGTSGRHEGHLHGNIGVTTSQEMLQAELDIDSWNLYEHIADIFVRELCIPVY